MFVFIDQSGDPGFKVGKGSTGVFVAALVAFRDVEQARKTQDAIEMESVQLGILPGFKFNKCRDEVRDAFFGTVGAFDFRVRAMVVQKEKIYSSHLRENKKGFYAFFVKSMLKLNEGLLENAQIIIDGSADREFTRELSTYFRVHLGKGRVANVRSGRPNADNLIQLADMCAGAIARSYRTDRSNASRWRDMLAPKIEDVWEFK